MVYRVRRLLRRGGGDRSWITPKITRRRPAALPSGATFPAARVHFFFCYPFCGMVDLSLDGNQADAKMWT